MAVARCGPVKRPRWKVVDGNTDRQRSRLMCAGMVLLDPNSNQATRAFAASFCAPLNDDQARLPARRPRRTRQVAAVQDMNVELLRVRDERGGSVQHYAGRHRAPIIFGKVLAV